MGPIEAQHFFRHQTVKWILAWGIQSGFGWESGFNLMDILESDIKTVTLWTFFNTFLSIWLLGNTSTDTISHLLWLHVPSSTCLLSWRRLLNLNAAPWLVSVAHVSLFSPTWLLSDPQTNQTHRLKSTKFGTWKQSVFTPGEQRRQSWDWLEGKHRWCKLH